MHMPKRRQQHNNPAKHVNRGMSDPEGFRKKKEFFEVILDDHPEAAMIFSMRLDLPQSLDDLKQFEIQDSLAISDSDYHYLAKKLNVEESRIISLNQVHGSEIVIMNSGTPSLEGDAIITGEAGCFPSIKTADCQAVLIIDPVKRITAAIHAGWRGTVQRITHKVILELEASFGCCASDLIAALGPSIGTCCYEVDETVLQPFRRCIPDAEQFVETFRITDPVTDIERLSSRIDLRKVNRFELSEAGVRTENIKDLNLCTQCHDSLFYSYRRDGANPGRLIALAGFRA